MPKVSIIVLNWNGRKFLENCLDSLQKLTYNSIEIIVVDNNSKDGSVELVKEKYPKILLVENKENHGFAKGNNIGYEKSNGEYILILNNDTKVTPDFLDPLVKTFEKDSTIGCVQPQIRLLEDKEILDGAGAFLTSTGFLYHFGYLKNKNKDIYNRQTEIFSAKGACMLLNRKAIEKVGLFDEDFFIFFEETDLCFRLWLSGFTVVYEPKSIIYHVGGADTTSSKSYQFERRAYLSLRNTFCSYLKNFGTLNLITILPIFIFLELCLAIYYLFNLKVKLAISATRALLWNARNIRKTLKKRKAVQHNLRTLSDWELNRKIIRNPKFEYYYYLLFGKLRFYKE